MAENDSSLEEKPKLSVFKHIIGTREISSTSSAQTLVSDKEILKIYPNDLSPTPSAAATCIGHCEDIFIQILLRLPPKSLLRFQCVSKQWHSVISNSDFRRLHGRTFHTCCLSSEFDALLLFQPGTSELNFISFSGENVKPMNSITTRLRRLCFEEILGLNSSNGLLCIQFFLNDYEEFIVCNPTTNCYRLIPKCEFAENRWSFPCAINICFDPLKSDHYKLLSIWADDEEDAYYFSIYYSETGIWKDTNFLNDITTPEYFLIHGGIFWNGNVHWMSTSGSFMCFDLNKESPTWSVPSLPILEEQGTEQGTINCWYFGESGDCLCAIEKSSSDVMLFHVFLMEKDYSGWFLKVSIDLNPLTILYHSMNASNYYPRFTHFLWCNNENKANLVISMAGKIILYNVSDKNVRELVKPIDPFYCWGRYMYNWNHKITFTATFACV